MNRTQRVIFTGLMIVVGLFTLAIWLSPLVPDRLLYKDEFEKSQVMITEAEDYQKEHGHVPSEVQFAKHMDKYGWFPTENCPCYQPLTNDSYNVFFPYRSVGIDMVYHSKTKMWSDEG